MVRGLLRIFLMTIASMRQKNVREMGVSAAADP